jgi:hypothetical protein
MLEGSDDGNALSDIRGEFASRNFRNFLCGNKIKPQSIGYSTPNKPRKRPYVSYR